MNPLDFVNNTDNLIKQMGISIKDAHIGDDDVSQNALRNGATLPLILPIKPLEELFLSTSKNN